VKVLIISMDSIGEGLPLALRAIAAGHAVRFFLGKNANKTIGEGFKGVEKVDNWLTSIPWADLVVPTGNHEYMDRLQGARERTCVFGPSAKSAQLEVDRAAGMEFFEDHDIEVPPYETFGSLSDAEAHVRKTEKRYVFKPLGDEDDKSLSYCSKSPADMVARLQRWQKLGMKLKGSCMLQEFIEGVEFAVSRWMGAEGFIGRPNENFERKKFLAGDVGPNCGEAGTILKYVGESPLFDAVLGPLEESLVAMGHIGDIDVNCIVDGKGQAWPLEFTMRLGWPAANIMWALHKGDPVEWMKDACEGEDTLEMSPRVAAGVVVAQPDYPYSKLTKKETDGVPIYGVTDENKRYISPQSVKVVTLPVMEGERLTEKLTWASAGDYLAVVTGTGKTVLEACNRAYKTVDELHVPDIIYRDDIGEALDEKIPELQKHGFAKEFNYQ
jgi:phosphoribosylamine---glycine ligase